MDGSRSHSEKKMKIVPKLSFSGTDILFMYTLLKVRHYDLSVLSMSVIGCQKSLDRWGELYPVFFWNFLNFAKPLRSLLCPMLHISRFLRAHSKSVSISLCLRDISLCGSVVNVSNNGSVKVICV